MNGESEAKWLRDRMQKLREGRDASAPAFEQVWRGALAQRTASRQKMAFPAWRLATASMVALLILATAISWSSKQRQRNRQMERDFAAVDATLLTYWQAPSDVFFPTASLNEPLEP